MCKQIHPHREQLLQEKNTKFCGKPQDKYYNLCIHEAVSNNCKSYATLLKAVWT